MADPSRRLYVELVANTSKFVSGMHRATSLSNRFNNNIKRLGATFGVTFGAIGAARFVKGTLAAFSEQQKATETLRAALIATGKDGSKALRELSDEASRLQRETTAADEAVQKATATLALLAPALSVDELRQAQKAMIGLAETFTEGNIESAAVAMGKTLGGTVDLLSRWGVTVGTAGSASERLGRLLDKTGRFFEVAKARAQTLDGATQQLKNAYGDLREELGNVIQLTFGLTDNSRTLTQSIFDWGTALRDNRDEIVAWGRLLVSSFSFAFSTVLNAFTAFFRAIILGILRIGEKFIEFQVFLKQWAAKLLPGEALDPDVTKAEEHLAGYRAAIAVTREAINKDLDDIAAAYRRTQDVAADFLAVTRLGATFGGRGAAGAGVTPPGGGAGEAAQSFQSLNDVLAEGRQRMADMVRAAQLMPGPLAVLQARTAALHETLEAALVIDPAAATPEVQALAAEVNRLDAVLANAEETVRKAEGAFGELPQTIQKTAGAMTQVAETAFQTVGNAIVNAMIYGLKDAAGALKAVLAAILNTLVRVGITALFASPYMVSRLWGRQLMTDMATGIRESAPQMQSALGRALTPITAPSLAVEQAASYSPQIVVDMRGVTLFGDPAAEARRPGSQVFLREGITTARAGGF